MHETDILQKADTALQYVAENKNSFVIYNQLQEESINLNIQDICDENIDGNSQMGIMKVY